MMTDLTIESQPLKSRTALIGGTVASGNTTITPLDDN